MYYLLVMIRPFFPQLLKSCRDSNQRAQGLIAECIGELGAVDPGRSDTTPPPLYHTPPLLHPPLIHPPPLYYNPLIHSDHDVTMTFSCTTKMLKTSRFHSSKIDCKILSSDHLNNRFQSNYLSMSIENLMSNRIV